jgi:hypothetical protein
MSLAGRITTPLTAIVLRDPSWMGPALFATLSLSAAGTAMAVTPAPSLDAPVIYQSLTVDPAGTDGYDQLYYSTTGAHKAVAGDFTRTGLSGGYADSFAYLGASPEVFAEGSAAYSGGESAVSQEVYEFEYVRPGAGTTPVSINFSGDDVIVGAGPNQSAQAFVFIAPYGQLNSYPLTLVAGDCDFAGVLGCAGDDNTDFQAIPTMSSISSIMVTPNTVYQVSLYADAGDQGGSTAASVTTSALVDPTLSLPTGTPGSLYFSAGVTEDQTGPAPEPEAWILMLAGMGIVGAGLRLARRPVRAPARA